jgi:serine/threonine-protein kinase RsbW
VSHDQDTWGDFDQGQLEVQLEEMIPGSVAEIPPLMEKIMAVVRDSGCAAGAEFEVEVALTEAIANAVRHGCRQDPGKQVQVSLACDPEKGMLVVVKDPGSGFDPSRLPSPVESENIFRSHGRGIFLMNQLMDEVQFREDGREVRMRRRPD